MDWVRPHLSDTKKFEQILDPRLDGKYELKSAQKLAAIASRCLVRHPKHRPRMSEVLEMVNLAVEGMRVESRDDDHVERSPPSDDEDERTGEESWRRRFLDHIMRDNKCLGLRSWRPEIVKTN